MTAAGGESWPKSRVNGEVVPAESVAVAEAYAAPPFGVGTENAMGTGSPAASTVTGSEASRYRPPPWSEAFSDERA